jgi:hypothetical protein
VTKPDNDVPPDVPPASLNPEKDPDEWVTKDEPMTGPQRSYLQTLCRVAKEEFGGDVPGLNPDSALSSPLYVATDVDAI